MGISNEYFSSSEFARLCGVPKSTLRYYRDAGIVMPATVLENGYSAYNPGQVFQVFLIRAFEEYGMSLSEIRPFMENPGADMAHSVAALHGRLEEQKRRIDSALAMHDCVEQYRSQLESDSKIQTVEHKDEQFFLKSDFIRTGKDRTLNRIYSNLELFDLCRRYFGINPYITGRSLSAENFLTGASNRVKNMLIPITRELIRDNVIPQAHILTTPPGLYLRAVYHGSVHSTGETYTRLLTAVRDGGYEISGSLTEIWIVGRYSDVLRDEYSAVIECPVKAKKSDSTYDYL